MERISKDLLPIKAHYFFFFAALGPLLPQMNVFGRQLGVSPAVMGGVTAVLPILWALAKPAVGYIVDYFQKQRKLIFMGLIMLMSGSYCCLYFLPVPPGPPEPPAAILDFPRQSGAQDGGPRWINVIPLSEYCNVKDDPCLQELQNNLIPASCGWFCNTNLNQTEEETQPKINIFIKRQNYTLINNTLTEFFYKDLPNTKYDCDIFNMDTFNSKRNATNSKQNQIDSIEKENRQKFDTMDEDNSVDRCVFKSDCSVFSCALLKNVNFSLSESNLTVSTSDFNNSTVENVPEEYYLYASVTFWGFVILMCVGTVAFNVANCIGDAVCFDVLGPERGMQYGRQRAWGTVGYGLTALAAGWLVDWASGGSTLKDFTPAFLLTIIFTLVDLFFCRKLQLPSMSRPEGAGGTLSVLLTRPRILVFLLFAVIAGMFDSFIIYYMFWFLEELATETQQMGNIKLLEGLTVAAQSFGGELLFFAISGKILKRFGFGHTLTFCLGCYGLRLFLISLITNPWQILAIELVMQGPTYALCYSTIVGYAAAVAPPGLSATLQGIVAGMDDGLGFALGSLLGGILYKYLGARLSFQCFAVLGVLAALVHAILVATTFSSHLKQPEDNAVEDGSRTDATDPAELGKLVPSSEANGKIVKNIKPLVNLQNGDKIDNVLDSNCRPYC